MTLPEAVDIVVAACALVGAALGIYNWFHARSQERVHLSVNPSAAYQIGTDYRGRHAVKRSENHLIDGRVPEIIAVEVTNLGHFDVTIKEVGFALRWSRGRLAVPIPLWDDEALPRRISRREAFTLWLATAPLRQLPSPRRVRRVYVTTACGQTAYGSSRALRHTVRALGRSSSPGGGG